MDTAGTHATKQEVERYYDGFREHQQKLGLNIRHRTIYRNALRAGLSARSNVLEIGCGIGTVSSLLLRRVTTGAFVGADISSESIAMASRNNSRSRNASFVVTDMSDFTSDIRFDFFVLPDVLEHIPQEQHGPLFRTIASVSAKEATILINIPEPNCLNHIRTTQPQKLQIIDQSLNLSQLIAHACSAGFELHSVEPYGLQFKEPEYVSIVLLRSPVKRVYHRKGFLQRAVENFKSKL